MVSLERTANNFCIAPWTSIYYQIDKASICCTSKDSFIMSPDEFRNSNYLKKIRKDFLEGKKPDNCQNCWLNESKGQKSIRSYYNNRKTYGDLLDIKFDENTQLDIKHMEIKVNNLCNFKCRMCNADSSIEIQREIEKFPEIQEFFFSKKTQANDICDKHWIQLIKMMSTTRQLFLTGGEPMLTKKYYDLLDYLIKSGFSNSIELNVYTNGSVYNPKFIERFKSFKYIKFHVSIDAVGKTAEYQRSGTIWKKVKENTLKFAAISNIDFYINTVHSAYTVLDVEALTDFYIEIYAINPSAIYSVHNVMSPLSLSYLNLNDDLRKVAIEQIKASLKKLNLFKDSFERVIPELENMLFNLNLPSNYEGYEKFIKATQLLDVVRKEKFEDIFGYKLY
jgi:MoaA/NifB/PqqE/SkfB family radical SAM enzyme